MFNKQSTGDKNIFNQLNYPNPNKAMYKDYDNHNDTIGDCMLPDLYQNSM